ncbi:uncharacterized protein LOC127831308 [Dreissena polymorpha]|uniref:uncharacterized protein LOC127831308 n=1 Tax=Dreissena polymorpha TaxID=45954 RepID=UPI002263D5B3|nr:uncharacterized protein LOC127831308 [Dreissena polymorpha]
MSWPHATAYLVWPPILGEKVIPQIRATAYLVWPPTLGEKVIPQIRATAYLVWPPTLGEKKVDCPARLQISAVCHFPSYKMNSIPSGREYRRITEAIFQTIQTGAHVKHFFLYYMALPSDDDQKGHPIKR